MPNPFVGVQLGAHSVFDEGADHLLDLLQETAGMKGPKYQCPPFPATWAKRYGKGRVFYTSMGHREDVWTGKIFQQILLGGLSWALGRAISADF